MWKSYLCDMSMLLSNFKPQLFILEFSQLQPQQENLNLIYPSFLNPDGLLLPKPQLRILDFCQLQMQQQKNLDID